MTFFKSKFKLFTLKVCSCASWVPYKSNIEISCHNWMLAVILAFSELFPLKFWFQVPHGCHIEKILKFHAIMLPFLTKKNYEFFDMTPVLKCSILMFISINFPKIPQISTIMWPPGENFENSVGWQILNLNL